MLVDDKALNDLINGSLFFSDDPKIGDVCSRMMAVYAKKAVENVKIRNDDLLHNNPVYREGYYDSLFMNANIIHSAVDDRSLYVTSIDPEEEIVTHAEEDYSEFKVPHIDHSCGVAMTKVAECLSVVYRKTQDDQSFKSISDYTPTNLQSYIAPMVAMDLVKMPTNSFKVEPDFNKQYKVSLEKFINPHISAGRVLHIRGSSKVSRNYAVDNVFFDIKEFEKAKQNRSCSTGTGEDIFIDQWNYDSFDRWDVVCFSFNSSPRVLDFVQKYGSNSRTPVFGRVVDPDFTDSELVNIDPDWYFGTERPLKIDEVAYRKNGYQIVGYDQQKSKVCLLTNHGWVVDDLFPLERKPMYHEVSSVDFMLFHHLDPLPAQRHSTYYFLKNLYTFNLTFSFTTPIPPDIARDCNRLIYSSREGVVYDALGQPSFVLSELRMPNCDIVVYEVPISLLMSDEIHGDATLEGLYPVIVDADFKGDYMRRRSKIVSYGYKFLSGLGVSILYTRAIYDNLDNTVYIAKNYDRLMQEHDQYLESVNGCTDKLLSAKFKTYSKYYGRVLPSCGDLPLIKIKGFSYNPLLSDWVYGSGSSYLFPSSLLKVKEKLVSGKGKYASCTVTCVFACPEHVYLQNLLLDEDPVNWRVWSECTSCRFAIALATLSQMSQSFLVRSNSDFNVLATRVTSVTQDDGVLYDVQCPFDVD